MSLEEEVDEKSYPKFGISAIFPSRDISLIVKRSREKLFPV